MTDRQVSKKKPGRQEVSSLRRGPVRSSVEALVDEMVDVGGGSGEDILCEPKGMDTAVCESGEVFGAITESSLDYILILDLELKVQFVNRAEPGLSKEEIIGTALYEFVDEADRGRVKGILQSVIDNSESVKYETFYKRPDGGEVYFESVATPMCSDGAVTGIVVISRNITERKKAEKDNSEKIRLIQILLDNMPCVAILIHPVTREIVALNEAAIKAGAICGGRCFETWGRRDTPCTFCHACEAWEHGENQHIEIELDGLWWDVRWVPISDDLYLHYAFDITDRKRSEEERAALLHDMGERVKELGCLYGISKLVENSDSLEEIVQGTVDLIPISWQYPESTCARIVVNDSVFETENFDQTKWVQRAAIEIGGDPVGFIEVYYLDAKPESDEGPFLKEERNLIEAIAERLGRIVERIQSQEKLGEYRDHLEELVGKRTVELEKSNRRLEDEISERKQAEEAIRLSEEKFSKAFHASPDSVTLTSVEDSVFQEANEGFERIFGYRREEVLGKSSFDFKIWERPEDRDAMVKVLKEKGRVSDYEISVRRESGEIRECLLSCELLDIDCKSYLLAVTRDITEQKRSERALEEMALFAELNPAPVLRFDKDGVIIRSNPAAISILGETSQPGCDLKGAMSCCGDIPIAEHICNDEVVTQECKIGDRYFQFVIRGISSLGVGQIYGSEITKRRLLEIQQKEQLSLLSHMSRLTTAGELASSLAHELNQPLCSIATLAEGCKRFMSSGDDGRGEVVGGIDKICVQAERAGKIIRRMSEFVKKHEEHYLPVDLNEVICASISLLESEAKKVGVTIHFDEEGSRWTVMADKIQIEQVLLNLLRNGIEAMAEVESNRRRLSVEVSELKEGFVEIAVIDKGAGLCEDDVERVFEPFYTTKPSGMGIGLSISRSIIESHGGRLWAQSVENCGTTFMLILPNR